GLGRGERRCRLRGGLVQIRGVNAREGASGLPGGGVLGQQGALGGDRADRLGLFRERASAELAPDAPRAEQNRGEDRRRLAPPAPFPRANSTLLPSRRAAETSWWSAALDREQPPLARNALELSGAAIVEGDARAGDEVLDGARDDHLAGARLGCDPRADMH